MSVTQGQPDPAGTLAIDNDSGGTGTTLTGTCAITTNPTVFYIDGTNAFSVPQGDSPDVITVRCDSDNAIDTHLGELTCSPDGLTPVQYGLACQINDGPQPVYNSVPAAGSTIVMSAANEGDSIDNENIVIDNESGAIEGQLVSVLNSTAPCSLSGSSKISLLTDGVYSLDAQSGQTDTETIACDSSEWDGGSPYTATLTCPNNDTLRTPAVYNIECSVGPKRQAMFDSTPASGTETDMTPGDVKTGDTIADQTLTVRNTIDVAGADMDISCGFVGDPGEIQVTDLGVSTLAPQQEASVTFSCPNDVEADSTALYRCTWSSVEDTPPDSVGAGDDEDYTYVCEVRGAEANVVSAPPSGAVLTEQVPSGGSGNFSVDFSIDPDEGVDGELVTCTVDDDVNFTVLSPTFPATIPSDGVVTVNVQGDDPGGSDEVSTTLRCTYEDSNTPDGGEEWTYTLVMEIGSFATFRVTKWFDDNNPAEVRVELHCNHGLPVEQGFNISHSQDVNFVLYAFDDGQPDCTVTEVNLDGYETTYTAAGESNPSDDADGCYFSEVGRGDVNTCQLQNRVLPVPIDVTKEWIVSGQAGNKVHMEASVTISSPTEIVGGYPCYEKAEGSDYGSWCQYLTFYGADTDTQTVMVYPAWDGVTVGIHEDLAESYIDSYNGCGGDVTIYPDDGASCTITNTVFFEGIPTLNQYGIAILILLTLGVGMVGFRRFS